MIIKQLDNKGFLLFVTSILFMTGLMGSRPLIPLLSMSLDASPFHIGVIISIFPLLPFVLAISLGQFVDKLGPRLPLLISAAAGGFSLLVIFIMTNLVGIYVSQLFAGLSQTLFAVAAQSYAGDEGNEVERDRNIMKFSMGAAIGSFLGPLIGGYMSDLYSYSLSFAALGVVSLLSAAFIFKIGSVQKGKAKRRKPQKLSRSFDLLKIEMIRNAFLISMFILLGKDIYIAFFPLLAESFGLSNTRIGLIVSINAGAGILIRVLMPYLTEKFGRYTVIFMSIISSGLFFIILPFFDQTLLLIFFSFLLGMGLGIGQPLSISATISALPKERVGEGLGLRITANRLTQLVSPFLFGMIAEYFGLIEIFWVVGVIICIGAFVTKRKDVSLQTN
jgi:MFS family permease